MFFSFLKGKLCAPKKLEEIQSVLDMQFVQAFERWP